MLRVGLTGSLGSGKSTAAALFAALGAHVLSSDAIGRELMQPGQSVYGEIVRVFGPAYLRADRQLDRRALAEAAFHRGRAEELNAIVHPAVIAEQGLRAAAIGREHPHAIVITESALILETKFGSSPDETKPWRARFDKLILMTAPEEMKIARFVERADAPEADHAALRAEAERRLALQMTDEQKAPFCDYVLTNEGPLTELEWQVDQLWPLLVADERAAS